MMGDLPVSVFKTKLGKDVQVKHLRDKKQKECEKLIGWVIKTKEKVEGNQYNIKPNEEFEVVNAINGKVVLRDVLANKYYIDLEYIRKNFELVCYLD